MNSGFGIVDLFAGPGGLGEGFSQAGSLGDTPIKICLSIEMEKNAVQTLRLRAFLRSFGNTFPNEYYDALNGATEFPDWSKIYPHNWAIAENEVQQLILGDVGVFQKISNTLDKVNNEFNGNTILIGGPPCQAYSLVGRARNQGKSGYVLEDDNRHYLYKEYVRILNYLKPAAFIMENVKGFLSSKVGGGGIFSRVLNDLSNSGLGYKLIPLSAPVTNNNIHPMAADFIVRSENYGVPQSRHRVFIVGVRNDIADGIDFGIQPLMRSHATQTTVTQALSDLPKLRSGLSRNDNNHCWVNAVHNQANRIIIDPETPKCIRSAAEMITRSDNVPRDRKSKLYKENIILPSPLENWIIDKRLNVVLHHETRGHIPADLGRYLYSALFAQEFGRAPKLPDFPKSLQPNHKNRSSGHFSDRFRTQVGNKPSTTITSHISKDGHYFIHPDPIQCRSLTVREAARLQSFPDNYFFVGGRTAQYHQVGNAVPPYLSFQIAKAIINLLKRAD